MPTSPSIVRGALGASVLAALTAALWWAWLGRDTSYQFDPETQQYSGPYTALQVAGLVLSLVAVGAVAVRWLAPWLVALAMTASFTVAWSVQAAGSDESGLWIVGALLLVWGMTVCSLAVSYGAHFGWKRLRAHS